MVGPAVLSGPRRSLRFSQRKSTVKPVATFLHSAIANYAAHGLSYRCAINVSRGHHHVIFPSSTASL
jgi:hypothetical protein